MLTNLYIRRATALKICEKNGKDELAMQHLYFLIVKTIYAGNQLFLYLKMFTLI